MITIYDVLKDTTDFDLVFDQHPVLVQIENTHDYLVQQHQGFSEVVSDNPMLLPPHPLMWFEYIDRSHNQFAYLVRVTKSAVPGVSMNLMIAEISKEGTGPWRRQNFRICLEFHGRIARDGFKRLIALQPAGQILPAIFDRLAVPLFVLSMLNCENVALDSIGQAASGPEILAIRVYSTIHLLEHQERKDDQSWLIKRGHQKDYRQGEGLFGRWHGVYWWSC